MEEYHSGSHCNFVKNSSAISEEAVLKYIREQTDVR